MKPGGQRKLETSTREMRHEKVSHERERHEKERFPCDVAKACHGAQWQSRRVCVCVCTCVCVVREWRSEGLVHVYMYEYSIFNSLFIKGCLIRKVIGKEYNVSIT